MGFVYQESTGRTGNEPVKVRFSTHGFPFIAAYASFSRLNARGASGRYTGPEIGLFHRHGAVSE